MSKIKTITLIATGAIFVVSFIYGFSIFSCKLSPYASGDVDWFLKTDEARDKIILEEIRKVKRLLKAENDDE